MSFDVFISYSSKNKPTADAVKHQLASANVRCWMAPDDVGPGKDWALEIINAIEICPIMVLIWTKDSMTSREVPKELNLAMQCGSVVIPFRLENIEPSGSFRYHLSSTHWLDAFDQELSDSIQNLCTLVLHNLPDRSASEDFSKYTVINQISSQQDTGQLAAQQAAQFAAEQEAERIANEEKAKQLAAEEEAERIANEEKVKQLAAEQEAERIANEEKAKQLAAEEEAERIANAEKAKQLVAEEKAERIANEEKAKQLAAEQEADRIANEEKAKQLAAEQAAQLADYQEANRIQNNQEVESSLFKQFGKYPTQNDFLSYIEAYQSIGNSGPIFETGRRSTYARRKKIYKFSNVNFTRAGEIILSINTSEDSERNRISFFSGGVGISRPWKKPVFFSFNTYPDLFIRHEFVDDVMCFDFYSGKDSSRSMYEVITDSFWRDKYLSYVIVRLFESIKNNTPESSNSRLPAPVQVIYQNDEIPISENSSVDLSEISVSLSPKDIQSIADELELLYSVFSVFWNDSFVSTPWGHNAFGMASEPPSKLDLFENLYNRFCLPYFILLAQLCPSQNVFESILSSAEWKKQNRKIIDLVISIISFYSDGGINSELQSSIELIVEEGEEMEGWWSNLSGLLFEAKSMCNENQVMSPISGIKYFYYDIPDLFFHELIDSEDQFGFPEALKILGGLCGSDHAILERYKLRVIDIIHYSLDNLIMPLIRGLCLPPLELVEVEKNYISLKENLNKGQIYPGFYYRLKIRQNKLNSAWTLYASQIKKINTLDSFLHQQFRDRI